MSQWMFCQIHNFIGAKDGFCGVLIGDDGRPVITPASKVTEYYDGTPKRPHGIYPAHIITSEQRCVPPSDFVRVVGPPDCDEALRIRANMLFWSDYIFTFDDQERPRLCDRPAGSVGWADDVSAEDLRAAYVAGPWSDYKSPIRDLFDKWLVGRITGLMSEDEIRAEARGRNESAALCRRVLRLTGHSSNE